MNAAESLKASVLFSGLDSGQSGRLADIGRETAAAAGEFIFKIGTEADKLHIIISGSVELTFPLLVMGEIKDVRFQTLENGRALAWSALVPPHILTMSARAATDATLYSFTRDRVLALWREDPRMGLVVMTNLARVIGSRLHEAQALWVRELQRNVSETYRG
ncbi:MAG: cyclic nucleotide-binding domain-containing protein [Deltaproteobacteria bacterium]|nr:cyclic nucleotide-binding domain-containing protein [Deltaproteobacteria bacterium]